MIFAGEKVRAEYSEATPELERGRRIRGVQPVPLADLVRLKLNSFRLKDQTHLKDLGDAGLITREVESGLGSRTEAGPGSRVCMIQK